MIQFHDSLVSTLTSPYSSWEYSSQNPIHDKIRYWDFSKTQSISVPHVSDVTKKQVKLLAHKIWNFMMLSYFLKYKAAKEFVSEINIITTLQTEEIIGLMRFLDAFI